MKTRTTVAPRTANGPHTRDRRPPAPSVSSISHVAYSSETGRSYRLDRLIGKGGFGEVYLAAPVPQSAGLPAQVCVKISDRLSAWLREAYFAELLAREPRALRVFDRFAEVEGPRMRYCLAMEFAEHGDLGAWLSKNGAQSRALRAPRDRRDPRRARRRCIAARHCIAISRRSTCSCARVEQLKLGRLRHRDASAQPPRCDRRRVQSAQCPDGDRVGQGAALAAARRHLPGRSCSPQCCCAATSTSPMRSRTFAHCHAAII